MSELWRRRSAGLAIWLVLLSGWLPLLRHVQHATEAVARGSICGVAPSSGDAEAADGDCCAVCALPDAFIVPPQWQAPAALRAVLPLRESGWREPLLSRVWSPGRARAPPLFD